jgi:hypothetical protein
VSCEKGIGCSGQSLIKEEEAAVDAEEDEQAAAGERGTQIGETGDAVSCNAYLERKRDCLIQ